MANNTVNIDVNIKNKSVGETQKTLQSLKKELKEVQNELVNLEEGSDAFTTAAKKAGELQNSINDVREVTRNLTAGDNLDKGLNTLISGVQGLTGAFALAQGASALFGSENEDLQKTLLKVQGSMAILNGLSAIKETLDRKSAFTTGVLTAAQNIYNASVVSGTNGIRIFGLTATAALAAATLGLSLLVTGVVLLLQNWEKVNTVIKNFLISVNILNSETKTLTNNTKEYNEELKNTKNLQEDIESIRTKSKGIEQSIRQLKLELQVLKESGASLTEITNKTIDLTKAQIQLSNNKIIYLELLKQEGRNSKVSDNLIKEEIKNLNVLKNTLTNLTNTTKVTQRTQQTLIPTLKEVGTTAIKTSLDVDKLGDSMKKLPDVSVSTDKLQDGINSVREGISITETLATSLNTPFDNLLLGANKLIGLFTPGSGFSIQEKITAGITAGLTAISGLVEGLSAKSEERFQRDIENLNELSEERNRIIDENSETEIRALDRFKLTEEQRSNFIREIENKNRIEKEKEEVKLRKQQEKLEKEQFRRRKRDSIILAAINGALAITNILATVPKVDFGVATAILIGAAAATTAAQIGVIASQKFNKGGIAEYNSGGKIRGPGTSKSDSIPAMLSNGESVINANSTRMFQPLLSRINEIGGGVRFATGGIAGGGSSNPSELFDSKELAREISLSLQTTPIRSFVVESEITSNQERVAQIKRKSIF